MSEEQKVTPFETSSSGIDFDYNKLIKDFGVSPISDELLIRFKKVTKREPHIWMKRNLFFAHRDLDKILDSYEKGKPIFIYTGRGPSSASLHLGHLIPIMFTKWLQDVFNAYVIVQIADDEKYFFKDTPFLDIYKQGFENAKDIAAVGFDPNRTFMFSNRDYSNTPCYKEVFNDIMKHTAINKVQAIFGIQPNAPIGQLVWPVWQTAAAFSKSFKDIFKNKPAHCLVAHAIDQDPYFRLARDIAPKLKSPKPSTVMCKFLPALKGGGKMSTTGDSPLIFLTDTEKQVQTKIRKYAYSGGRQTKELHEELGGIIEVDVSYKYLTYFEEDDKVLQEISDRFSSGKMLASEMKDIAAKKINQVIIKFKKDREKITPEVLQTFYV